MLFFSEHFHCVILVYLKPPSVSADYSSCVTMIPDIKFCLLCLSQLASSRTL